MAFSKPPRYYVKKRLLEIRAKAQDLIATADDALREIEGAGEVCVYRWRCLFCGHVRSFTKPQKEGACGECEKCKNQRWKPLGDGSPLSD